MSLLVVTFGFSQGHGESGISQTVPATSTSTKVALRQRYDETGKTDVPEDASGPVWNLEHVFVNRRHYRCFVQVQLQKKVRKGRRYYEDSAAHVPTPPKAGSSSNPNPGDILYIVSLCFLCGCVCFKILKHPGHIWRKRFDAGSATRNWALQPSFARRNWPEITDITETSGEVSGNTHQEYG